MDLQIPCYAYMFGFLQADGHLARRVGQKGRLTVEINARDIEILRAFQRLTPHYSSITERVRAANFSPEHHSATWSPYAAEARAVLNELGMPYGKKSLTIRPPRREFSRPDYLRGIIDADGSLGWTAQGYPYLALTSASTALAAYLCHYAKKVTGTARTMSRNARDGVYNICYYKETAQRLAAHFYYDGCLAVPHQKANVESIQTWVRPPDMRVAPPRRRWTAREDRELIRLGHPDRAAAALDRTPQSCTMRLWRIRSGQVTLTPPPAPSLSP
ncbi:hypothetical protein AB0P15_30230 [Streptomyces sp. NPDC087917]|uniref:hypothetical protein n=1 Tax=Streptomyces sp. NPDC087917 TaxID=3155060 RepID=UPI00343EBED2